MAEDTRQIAKLSKAKVHWSVHVIDKSTNIGIRIGGLLVIFAVLGLVFFIFSQVLPLFQDSEHGEFESRAQADAARPVALHADEYRRVALRINEDIQNISGATLSCVHITDGIRRLLITHDVAIRQP